jgi:hypothetical protein
MKGFVMIGDRRIEVELEVEVGVRVGVRVGVCLL